MLFGLDVPPPNLFYGNPSSNELSRSDCKKVLSLSRHLKQPPPVAKCRKVNSRRRIPPLGAITGTELQSDLPVAIRNPQWRPA